MQELPPGNTARIQGGLNNPRVLAWACAAVWLVPLLVIAVLTALDPVKHSVTPVYHMASENWWAGKNLFGWELRRFHYLPVFAVLFSPFHLLPQPAGDILWRFLSTGLLAAGIWRLLRQQTGTAAGRAFLLVSLLILPLCLGAMRNGQANTIFAGLLLHGFACIPERRWWLSAAFLAAGVAVKPLGMVPVLLAACVYAPLRWRCLVALAALALLPFLFATPKYVVAQHGAFLKSLQAADSVITEHRFADIKGIIRTFGAELPEKASKLIRVLAGGGTLILCIAGTRRLREPLRALWVLTLAAGYLMLFNPMTESNSYVIFAPMLGIWGILASNREKGRIPACGIIIATLSMGFLPTLLRPLFGNLFSLFWYPLITAAFLCALAYFLLGTNGPFADRPESESQDPAGRIS